MFSLTLGLATRQQDLVEEVQPGLEAAGCKVLFHLPTTELASLLEKLNQACPDILVIDLRDVPKPWQGTIGAIKAAFSRLFVVALHESADPADIFEGIRAGADEFVYPPYLANLLKALSRLEVQRVDQSSGSAQGQLIVLVSVKGGCGATTLATQLAGYIAKRTKEKTLLADLDLELGLAAFLLKVRPPYSSADALNNVHRLDWSYWQALVTTVSDQYDFLAAPLPQEVQVRPPVDNFRRVVRFACSSYRWVLVDLGRGLSELVVCCLEEGATLLVVTTAELPALYQLKRFREAAEQYGVSSNQFKVILNRYRRDAELSPMEVERMIGIPISATLPEDREGIWEICADGGLIQENTLFGRQLNGLVSQLTGQPAESRPRKRFLLFGS